MSTLRPAAISARLIGTLIFRAAEPDLVGVASTRSTFWTKVRGVGQETYKIEDEAGNILTGGEIEAFAWEYFHNHKFEFDNSQADFIATLTYKTTKQGGRKTEKIRQILTGVLRDAFYTTLLGLDGEAQIGERQETYKIEDEAGNILTGGEIEAFAWEYFHNHKFEFDTFRICKELLY